MLYLGDAHLLKFVRFFIFRRCAFVKICNAFYCLGDAHLFAFYFSICFLAKSSIFIILFSKELYVGIENSLG